MNMVNRVRDDEDEKPLDPAVENVRRKLLRFMLVNLGLLGIALIAVVGAIVYKSRTAAPDPAAVTQPALQVPNDGAVAEGSIALPAGARIVSQSLSGERVSLHVEEPSGQASIYLYDLSAGRMVARFVVKAGN